VAGGEEGALMAKVSFKTKLRSVDDGGKDRVMVAFKSKVTRCDCNLRSHQHTYYNSDLFEPMLNRAYREVINQPWAWMDSLPSGVSVDDSGFLALVTVELPESFNR